MNRKLESAVASLKSWRKGVLLLILSLCALSLCALSLCARELAGAQSPAKAAGQADPPTSPATEAADLLVARILKKAKAVAKPKDNDNLPGRKK